MFTDFSEIFKEIKFLKYSEPKSKRAILMLKCQFLKLIKARLIVSVFINFNHLHHIIAAI